MRNMFAQGELPGETPTVSAGSDVSSFTQMSHYVQLIYDTCSKPEVDQPGWYPAGKGPLTSCPTRPIRLCRLSCLDRVTD